MGTSALSASQFYKDVEKNLKVYSLKDDKGYPAPKTRTEQRSMPFWSSASRVEKIIQNIPAYAGFKIVEMEIDEFRDKWLTMLQKENQLVGINWSGKNAVGYDLNPQVILDWIETFAPRKKRFYRRFF